MKFQLEIPDFKADYNLKHGEGVVLLGSCFSDSMLPHFSSNGFRALSNPFGTIFHPIALGQVLSDAIEQNPQAIAGERDGLWFDWRFSGKFFGDSEEELQSRVQIQLAHCFLELRSARLLVVTFGTAWAYYRKGHVVGNCHKMPQDEFEKKLSDVDEMLDVWADLLPRILEMNPELQVIFTVSPVRHIKDGLVENNRSKARLVELSHQLSEEFGAYFPSYEIVTDVLRDYRFFKEDMVHPTDQAVRIVWDHFTESLFNDETKELCKNVHQLNQMIHHKSLHPESKEDQRRVELIAEKKQALLRKNPMIYFEQ